MGLITDSALFFMKIRDITPSWFFTNTNLPFKLMQIYILGDALVLVPFYIILLLIGIFSLRWMVLLFGVFLSFRFLGEMFYWLLQQFGERKYRPFDYGFKKLDNKAIYIIYQLKALVGLVLSTGLVIFVLFKWLT